MEALVCMVLTLLVSPVTMIWSGYVLSVLWGWFVVPVFGLPPLGIATAIGLAIVVSYLTFHYRNEVEGSSAERLAQGIAFALVKPAFALAFGFVVSRFL